MKEAISSSGAGSESVGMGGGVRVDVLGEVMVNEGGISRWPLGFYRPVLEKGINVLDDPNNLKGSGCSEISEWLQLGCFLEVRIWE